MDDLNQDVKDIIDCINASVTREAHVLGHLAILADVCENNGWTDFEKMIRLSMLCGSHNIAHIVFNNEKLLNKLNELHDEYST